MFLDKRYFQKLEKKSENIHMYADKLTNQFWLKKATLPVFCWTIFFTNYLILKIWKYSYVYGQIDKSILAKKKLHYRFFVEQFFLLII